MKMKLDTASVIHNKAHSHLEYFQIILFKTIDTTGVTTHASDTIACMKFKKKFIFG